MFYSDHTKCVYMALVIVQLILFDHFSLIINININYKFRKLACFATFNVNKYWILIYLGENYNIYLKIRQEYFRDLLIILYFTICILFKEP